MTHRHERLLIDLSRWPRRGHYDLFKACSFPYAGITTTVDVSRLVAACRPGGDRRFLPSMLHLVAAAVNAIPNFRYRQEEDGVVEYAAIDPSFTVLDRATELFYFAIAAWTPDFPAFAAGVAEAQRQAIAARRLHNPRQDVFYTSCLPWMSFSQLIQPMGPPPDSIPRIVWGRHDDPAAPGRMAFSVIAHHGFVDGLHIGRLVEAVSDSLASVNP